MMAGRARADRLGPATGPRQALAEKAGAPVDGRGGRSRAQLVGSLGAAWILGLGCLGFGAGAVASQSSFRWTTNYYTVTGSTPREIRFSINHAKPWKARNPADAVTTWSVDWNYTVVSTGQRCRPEAVSTVTTVTTTLPRYVASTNSPAELRRRWAAYSAALARHEAQHAALGRAAAADIESRLASSGERRDCDALRRDLNALAKSLIEQRRREERELDERTRHGATDGAQFP